MQVRIGDVVGSYEILGLLGQGGMATVYKAYHAKLRRNVALKMIHASLVEDSQFVQRFEREAQIIAALDHPHILPVYDYSEHDGQPYLVMKFIEGKTLKQYNAGSSPDFEAMLNLMQPIADALDYAHGQGILHRDVKPSNIMLDGQITAYLTDFGLARLFENADSTISQSMLIGTPAYMSPEQAQGNVPVDRRSDLYSLGVVLYEMIAGQVPFSSGTPHVVIHDQIYRPLPPPTDLNPNVPEPVEAVLLKALDKEPEKRYDSANALMGALRIGFGQSHEAAATAGKPNLVSESVQPAAPIVGSPLPPIQPTATANKKPHRRWIAFGCLAFAILGVVFALSFLRQLRELRVQRTVTSAAQVTAQLTPIRSLVYEVPLLPIDDAQANLRINQEDDQAYLAVVQAQFAAGDPAGAQDTLTSGLGTADDAVRYLLTAVSIALDYNDINTAYLLAGEALDQAAGTGLAQAARAWVGEQLYGAASGESPNPILLRRTASERGIPLMPLLQALAANSLLAHNRLPAAIAAIDTALAENPSVAEVLLINGEVLAARGNDEAARQNWQLAQDQADAPDWVRARARTLLASNST